jgi:zinc protease
VGEGTKRGLIVLVILLMATIARADGPATRPVDYGAESYRATSKPDEIVAVLNNGMTVIVKRVQSPVLAVRAYAKTGGVYEGKWLGGGLSHLLEHLVAGGTNERRTEEQNRNLLQKIGNNSNAYTTYDHTCFYVNTTTEHLDEAVDLVAGWMLGAKITPEEYAREYQVVQRELEMDKGEPDRVFQNLTQENRYRVNPARVPVIGYQEVIQGLSRDDVYSYYRLAYQPNNLVFAVAGDIDPEKMLDVVRRNVAEAKPGREFPHDITPEPPVLAPRKSVATFPKLGQAKIDIGFPSVQLDNPDLYALDLLATILGGGESSVLVEELRDKRQLVSVVGASDDTPSYVEGTFSIMMELDPDPQKMNAATQAALEQVEKLKAEPIDENRVARAKAQFRANRIKQMQTAEDTIGTMATDFISSDDAHFSEHYVDRVQKVTAEQLQAVARKYLDPARLVTTTLMPAEAVAKKRDASAAEGVAKADERVTRLQLDNGMTLLHKRVTTSPIVEVRMYAQGGLTAEDERTNGLGNMTMEMLARGTKTRSAEQIAEFFDSIGGDLDTGSGNNSWYWNMTCLKEDFPKAMQVWGDVVSNPSFPQEEIPAVRQRILGDIESQDADWNQQATRFFRKSYFGPMKSPYQFMPIGQKEIIEKAGPDQLRDWYQTKVLKGRRVLAIFGDVTLDDAKKAAMDCLGAEARSENVGDPAPALAAMPQAAAPSPQPQVNVIRVEVQPTEQALAGIIIGYKSDSVISRPSPALDVLDTMTSGWGYPTGYLFDILRGRGLVYVVHATDMPGVSDKTPGTFFAYAGCDPKNVNEVVDVILENIARCQGSDQDMQPDWFQRSKQLITVGDAMDNETAAQQATTAALDELFGLGYDYHQHFAERINAVTLDQVRQAAKSMLRECVVTVSTPRPDLVSRQTGVRTYKSFPPVELTNGGVKHDAGK